jgi:biopolymer transport protein ExbD
MAKSVSHQKKFDTRIDFTPMVDMNMLLITFFMLCTTMIKSQTLQISLPTNEKVQKNEQNKVKQSEAVTIIIDGTLDAKGRATDGKVYYYDGMPEVADANHDGKLDNNKMKEISLGQGTDAVPAIRQILRERNEQVVAKIDVLKKDWKDKKISDESYQDQARKIRNDSTLKRPVVIIKATPNASYSNLVSVLDEMQINNISRYQIDRINAVDSAMMIELQGKARKK